jgi:hypothetical protein
MEEEEGGESDAREECEIGEEYDDHITSEASANNTNTMSHLYVFTTEKAGMDGETLKRYEDLLLIYVSR